VSGLAAGFGAGLVWVWWGCFLEAATLGGKGGGRASSRDSNCCGAFFSISFCIKPPKPDLKPNPNLLCPLTATTSGSRCTPLSRACARRSRARTPSAWRSAWGWTPRGSAAAARGRRRAGGCSGCGRRLCRWGFVQGRVGGRGWEMGFVVAWVWLLRSPKRTDVPPFSSSFADNRHHPHVRTPTATPTTTPTTTPTNHDRTPARAGDRQPAGQRRSLRQLLSAGGHRAQRHKV